MHISITHAHLNATPLIGGLVGTKRLGERVDGTTVIELLKELKLVPMYTVFRCVTLCHVIQSHQKHVLPEPKETDRWRFEGKICLTQGEGHPVQGSCTTDLQVITLSHSFNSPFLPIFQYSS
jgi:hypothetical protein